ncbi:MAG: SRPBCC family protein [Pyrinomonadaceae bacterium]
MQTATLNNQMAENESKNSRETSKENVGKNERILSAVGGGALAFYGFKRGGWSGILAAIAGGSLIKRGVTGYCEIYDALGTGSAEEHNKNVSVEGGAGVKVEESVIVNKSAEEIYRFWRNFENLPRVMSHLESVTADDDGRKSHWIAKAPLGQTVEWDAEIINDHPNEMIAWRSLENSQVANAGSVHFRETGNGTEVRVVLKYDPPGGKIGAAVAKLFGEEPEQQITEDLRRFKSLMESNGNSTV